MHKLIAWKGVNFSKNMESFRRLKCKLDFLKKILRMQKFAN